MKIITLIQKAEHQKFSFFMGFLSLSAVIVCRNILESAFEGSQVMGFSPLPDRSFYMVFVHFPLFYISLYLWILYVLSFITREQVTKVAKIMLVYMPIILITPFIDIIVSKGSGYKLTYLSSFEQFTELHAFFNFTRDLLESSWGQRIEIALVLIGTTTYVFLKTRRVFKSLFCLIIVYLLIFLHGVLPNTIARIPWYLGVDTLSFKTIITNGIARFDSQNYAVVFALSCVLVGLLLVHTYKKEIGTRLPFNKSLLFLPFLGLGILYGIARLAPYYRFIFNNPFTYAFFICAGLSIVIAENASTPRSQSLQFQIFIISSVFLTMSLGHYVFVFIVIFFLMRRYVNVKLLAAIPCFLAGFAVIFQNASFIALLPSNGESEIHGRELSGWTHFLNGNYDSALLQYEQAYSLRKDNEIAKRLGQCYLNLGRRSDCISLLENISEPDYEILVTLGQAYTQQGTYSEAIQVYTDAMRRDIEQADFAQRIAELAARQGKKEIMEQAIKLSEKYGSPQYKTYQIQGDFYLGVQDNKKALQMHEKALAYNPRSVPSLVGTGIVHYYDGDIQSAEAQFLKALDIEPENDAIYNNLGALYMMTGRDEEAESYFEKSLKLNPHQTEAYYNLGLINEKRGNIFNAIEMYGKAVEMNPSYMPALRKLEELAP